MCLQRSLGGRGIKDIDFVITIVEAHHRCSYRNTTLLLNLHPVAGGSFLNLIAFNGSGDVDSSAEKEQFLGKCCLAGVGVRNDCESAPAAYFIL